MQGFAVTGGQGGFFSAVGQALQQAAAAAMAAVGRRCHAQSGVATEGAKQQAGAALDFVEADGGLGMVAAGGLGDEAVPETADVLFHGGASGVRNGVGHQ